MKYITFPWEQLGRCLRSLSLSGSAANAVSWLLYLIIGAIPLMVFLFLAARHLCLKCDWLLAVLSISLYIGLWFFINPSYMDLYLSPLPTGGFSKYILAAVIDSILFTWILLRVIACYEKADSHRLLPALRILLYLYAFLLGAQTLLQGGSEFWDACRELGQRNTAAHNQLLTVSTLFLALQFIVKLLPILSEVFLLVMAAGFLCCFEKEAFGPKAYAKLEQLKICSGRFLMLILLSNVGLSILQLLCARFILSSSHIIAFPLPEIIIVLGIRTMSFFYLESKRLKEDNDMFI